MTEFWVALGLVLVLEGVLYALFPEAMQRMMRLAIELSPANLRRFGLIGAFAGFFVVWVIKG